MSSRVVQTKTETSRTVESDGTVVEVVKTTEVKADGSESVSVKKKTISGGSGTKTKSDEKSSSWFGSKTGGKTSAGSNTKSPDTKSTVSLSDFRKRALEAHNKYRAQHGAKPLKLSDQLNAYAQEWAEQMAKTGRFAHRPDKKYGENLYYGMNSKGITPEDAVKNWYDEILRYDFNKQGFTPGTGHFTQVVWKASKELGIGMVEPKPGTYYVVGNYSPAGNVLTQFDENVSPKK